ncbi:hypothetical protein ACOSP7_018041 [Xanthoceras sorbifolium]
MTSSSSMLFKFLIIQCLVVVCFSQNFGFFYLIQQWPGSVSGTEHRCCYSTAGKPATNFTIHGLWPYGIDGTQPTFCKPHNHFKKSKMSDLSGRMQVSWPSLACPSALKLKDKIDLLQILKNSGIKPDGKFYGLFNIRESLRGALGYEPGVYCNVDKWGNNQLYQIFICLDPSWSKVIECPGLPNAGRGCASKVKFPAF